MLEMFEGLAKHLFKEIKGLEFGDFPRMTWHDAMRLYGSDKPDIRFGMQFVELNDVVKGHGFGLFDGAELVVGINAEGCAEYTRKQLDALTDEREIDRLGRQVEDRFGPLPREVQNLLFVVKIRNLGGEMGFEKIIIKNGMQIMFFVNNPMSAYYKSKRFETILSRVNENPTLFKFNQDGGKLRTVSRGVNTLSSALHILKKLQ